MTIERTRRGAAAWILFTVFAALAPRAFAACTVDARGIAFGAYDPLSGAALDGAGDIAVTCDAGLAYTIALSSGGGSYAERRLASGGDSLAYNLFTSAARLFVWGDGSGGTSTVSGSGTGSSVDIPIYGRIAAGQNVRAGAYADGVIVTISF